MRPVAFICARVADNCARVAGCVSAHFFVLEATHGKAYAKALVELQSSNIKLLYGCQTSSTRALGPTPCCKISASTESPLNPPGSQALNYEFRHELVCSMVQLPAKSPDRFGIPKPPRLSVHDRSSYTGCPTVIDQATFARSSSLKACMLGWNSAGILPSVMHTTMELVPGLVLHDFSRQCS